MVTNETPEHIEENDDITPIKWELEPEKCEELKKLILALSAFCEENKLPTFLRIQTANDPRASFRMVGSHMTFLEKSCNAMDYLTALDFFLFGRAKDKGSPLTMEEQDKLYGLVRELINNHPMDGGH